jgi:hypothetical protein
MDLVTMDEYNALMDVNFDVDAQWRERALAELAQWRLDNSYINVMRHQVFVDPAADVSTTNNASTWTATYNAPLFDGEKLEEKEMEIVATTTHGDQVIAYRVFKEELDGAEDGSVPHRIRVVATLIDIAGVPAPSHSWGVTMCKQAMAQSYSSVFDFDRESPGESMQSIIEQMHEKAIKVLVKHDADEEPRQLTDGPR